MNCGHAHADALSFELAAGGGPILVDPGTCTYADPALRDAFRSAAVHNAVTIDGLGASEPSSGFQWQRWADAHCTRWEVGERFSMVAGELMDLGGSRVEGRHRRAVLFAHGSGWLIDDRVAGTTGKAWLRFQCAPGAVLRHGRHSDYLLWARVEIETAPARALDIIAVGPQLVARVAAGRVSPVYGRCEDAPAWIIEAPVPAHILTILLPTGVGAAPPQIRREPDEHGRILQLKARGVTHQIGAGEGSPFRVGTLETDARMVWRRSGDQEGVVAVDARWVAVGGNELPMPGTKKERAAWIETRSTKIAPG